MNKDLKSILIVVLSILAATFVCAMFYLVGYRDGGNGKIETRVDTIVMTDTVRLKELDTITEIKLHNVVTKVPFWVHDTTIVYPKDTIWVHVERTQKHYHKDSVADIWVSGVEPELDSANIIRHERTIIETRYIPMAEYRNAAGAFAGNNAAGVYYQRSVGERLHIGCSLGSDYSGKVQLSAGIGYRF